jgi:hypothetical protein
MPVDAMVEVRTLAGHRTSYGGAQDVPDFPMKIGILPSYGSVPL